MKRMPNVNISEPSDDSMKPPQFTQKLKDLTVNDGEQLELNVKVDGDPEPQITWNKNGKVSNYILKIADILIETYTAITFSIHFQEAMN